MDAQRSGDGPAARGATAGRLPPWRGRGETAHAPDHATVPLPPRLRPLGPRGVALLLRRTASKAWDDRILGLSAEAGFWQLLSLPPLLLAVLGTIGFFGRYLGADTSQRIQNYLTDVLGHVLAPAVITDVVQPIVGDILRKGRADVVSIGFVISLWSGSSAMATYVNTITIAYDMRMQRTAWRSRALAFGLYLLAVAYLVVVLPLLVVGPGFITHRAPALRTVVAAGYWPVLVVAGLLGVATLYHLAVPVRTNWYRDLPGAAAAMLLWVGSSVALRFYLGAFLSRESVYGQLGAVVAVLLFLYFTALSVLLGAELNAQIDKLWPTPVTAAARRDEHRKLAAVIQRREQDIEWRRSEGRD
ncbi:MAG: YihY/virulence factor BrkB family protein [Frankiaceae bacterium]